MALAMTGSPKSPPVGISLVRREDHRTFFIAARDQLKEEGRSHPINGEIADFVDVQEFEPGELLDILVETSFLMGLDESGN